METLDFATRVHRVHAIVRAKIPRSVFNQLDHTHLDPFIFKSGSITAEGAALELLNRNIVGGIVRVY